MAGAKQLSFGFEALAGDRSKQPAKASNPDDVPGIEALAGDRLQARLPAAQGERGELPAGWEWRKLDAPEVAELTMGQSPPSDTYNTHGDGLPFFQGKADFGPVYPNPRFWCNSPKKIAQKNDILISVRAPVGPTNISTEECCIGRGLAAIRAGAIADYLFLFYYLRSVEAGIAALGQGSTFASISKTQLAQIEIPLPPLPEQRRIVARIEEFARRVEEASRLRREAAEGVEGILPAAISQCFDASDDWESDDLGIVAQISARQVDPKESAFQDLPHISGESIESGTCRLLEYRTVAEDSVISGKYLFKLGDVLYSKIRPYLKKATQVDFAGLCSADMYPLESTSPRLLPRFLMWSCF